jgi:hypothetical protein
MRRLKNVSVSIPSVTGPYTGVSCTLTLLGSSVRISSLLINDSYERQGSEDDRFIDYPAAAQSIVTSSGSNDGGLFETSLQDERYLPFEGAGAESAWSLELPASFRQFNYNTISDVLLHIRYTARPGGALLRDRAVAYVEELVQAAGSSGLALLFSLKHDFPTEWSQFLGGDGDFTATVRRDYFPYFTQGREINIDVVQVCAIQESGVATVTPAGLDLAELTSALNDEGSATLSLAPDESVLVRDQQANIFILVEYSLA